MIRLGCSLGTLRPSARVRPAGSPRMGNSRLSEPRGSAGVALHDRHNERIDLERRVHRQRCSGNSTGTRVRFQAGLRGVAGSPVRCARGHSVSAQIVPLRPAPPTEAPKVTQAIRRTECRCAPSGWAPIARPAGASESGRRIRERTSGAAALPRVWGHRF